LSMCTPHGLIEVFLLNLFLRWWRS
jgi:hypothetical protein